MSPNCTMKLLKSSQWIAANRVEVEELAKADMRTFPKSQIRCPREYIYKIYFPCHLPSYYSSTQLDRIHPTFEPS